MKYIIKESKMDSLIEKFIYQKFSIVKKVYFTEQGKILGSTPGQPIVNERRINIILDNSENLLKKTELFEIESIIKKSLNSMFNLNLGEYESLWSVSVSQLAVVGIHQNLLKLPN
jgi:hypothetical protein